MNAQAPSAADTKTATLRIEYRVLTPEGRLLYTESDSTRLRLPADVAKGATVPVDVERPIAGQLYRQSLTLPADFPDGASLRVSLNVTAREHEVVGRTVERDDDGNLQVVSERRYQTLPEADALNAARADAAKQTADYYTQEWYPPLLEKVVDAATKEEARRWRQTVDTLQAENVRLKRRVTEAEAKKRG